MQSDFQLIADTNRDLRQDVREGRFREDLLARINPWTFRLPALRERPEDVEPSIDYELERYARLNSATVRPGAARSMTRIGCGNILDVSTLIGHASKGGRLN